MTRDRDEHGRARNTRDRDEHGRARNARPRDGLGRPLPRGAAGTERVPDDLVLPPLQSLAQAQALLDAGRPFHAHEVLEGTWKAAPQSERDLWQGLAQVAVGLTHRARGNPTGAVRLLKRAAERLAGYSTDPPYGIPLQHVLATAMAIASNPAGEHPPLRIAPPVHRLLRLRPLRSEEEPAALLAHQVMAREGFDFLLGHEPGMSWSAYLRSLAAHRRGEELPPGFVPGTFLAADVGGALVGRASVRHGLNEFLTREGGHIGYGVLPEHRRRGYATEILRQSLVIARAEGVERVLVTCDDDNLASIAVIEACGGRLDPDQPTAETAVEPAALMRRYWID